ncbi:hypothetical protein C0J52_25176 [Blattella germanica]|nr:hypothetical protein C0J52_25176 [Blattella germanica]
MNKQINCLTDFCTIKCDGREHTACIYKNGVSDKCKDYMKKDLQQEDKDYILKLHNDQRRLIANGEKPTRNSEIQPKASNMMEMVWDEELAYVAQVWANQCHYGHDKCHNVPEFKVGQNVGLLSATKDVPPDLGLLVNDWFNEVKYMTKDIVEKFRDTGEEPLIRHYTQFVWATSKYVGCGQSYFTDDRDLKCRLLICNYGPAGNVVGEKLYEVGDSCSACDSDTSCEDIFYFSVQINGLTDFCKIKCEGNEHTACIYKTRSDSCKEFVVKDLQQADKDTIVQKHNDLRRKIAKGEKPTDAGAVQPKAANMMEMVWDDELAYVARVWAFQCTFEHDKCRDVEDFPVGQNLAIQGSTLAPTTDLGMLIQGWFDEVKDFDSSLVGKFQKTSGPAVGHYTQLVWGASQYIGCGQSFYTQRGFKSILLVCVYGPAGNFLGEKMYLVGDACSKCSGGAACKDGLCQNKGPRKWDVFCFSVPINGLTDFCKIKCDGNEHTACIYKTRSDSCNEFVIKDLQQADKDTIVQKHNDLRRKIAKGEKPTDAGAVQPKAANMMEMVWDDELAYVARVWAFQCTFEHDKCRDVEDFPVGQNLAIQGSTLAPTTDLGMLIQGWFDEVKDFDSSLVGKFQQSSGPAVGHYTQLVWGASQYVGCGQSFYTQNGFKNIFLVCNYGPAGNFLGQKMYEVGDACSKCSGGAACKDSLCANKGPRTWDGAENPFASANNLSGGKTMAVLYSVYISSIFLFKIKDALVLYYYKLSYNNLFRLHLA